MNRIRERFMPQAGEAAAGMEEEAVDEQHARGRLTARERVDILFDAGSFVELGADQSCQAESASRAGGDGVVTGYGTVDGRLVFAYAKDMTVLRGTMAGEHGRKIVAVQQLALDSGAPIVALHDSHGTRLDEADVAYAAFGRQYRQAAKAKGVIPQVAVVLGACIGADALLAATADFIFMAGADSTILMGDPDTTRMVTGESLSSAELGGAEVHETTTGLAHAVFDNDIIALRQARRLLSFLPAPTTGRTQGWRSFDDPQRVEPSLDFLIPADTTLPFDVKEVVGKVVDEGDFFELQPEFAGNAVVGFGRIDGQTVGVVANQPSVLAGVLNAAAAAKIARFVGQCDALGFPVLTFVDAAGFVPGMSEEHAGVVGHAASLLCAYARAKVPLITVILRKSYGAAGLALGSRLVCADITFGWPQASIGLMAPRDTTAIGARVTASRDGLTGGGIDAIIAPAQTRAYIARALSLGGKTVGDSPRVGRLPS
ncbi:acyl-CoA carboxylase subunit beta [Cupriavidus numazuensis]|uniref:Propionyl-CoA carboxylase beta chain n=1 Tax=Cupriavidus numazuensis TaxID=221992 RepID=A0ABN7PY10_9BURK|nr:carboxyl transferase domain-containing protein [Cupriavidus numazuensis]CAG2142721.1 Propionyl-CoA carboxylase beta chain [Cupriavidus numazuensis]